MFYDERQKVLDALTSRVAAEPQFEVRQPVVAAVAIPMVHTLPFQEPTSQVLLHHISMLQDVSAIGSRDKTIASRSDAAFSGSIADGVGWSERMSLTPSLVVHSAEPVSDGQSGTPGDFARQATVVLMEKKKWVAIEALVAVMNRAKAFGFHWAGAVLDGTRLVHRYIVPHWTTALRTWLPCHGMSTTRTLGRLWCPTRNESSNWKLIWRASASYQGASA